MPYKTIIITIIFLGLFNIQYVLAEDVKSTQAKAQPPKDTPKANKISQVVLGQGVISCVARINQVTNYLGYRDNTSAVLMVPSVQQDQQLISIVMAVPMADSTAYASADFAPNQSNGCGATYDGVVYWPDKCEVVSTKQFSAFKKTSPLNKDVSMLDGGAFMKVFLMKAGTGCVSIKKEVVQ